MAYKSRYETEDYYPYRERRWPRVLGYVATFAAGLVIGALLFGPWLKGGPKKPPAATAATAAPTALTAAKAPGAAPPTITPPTAATVEEMPPTKEKEEVGIVRFTPPKREPRVEPAEAPAPPSKKTPALTGKGLPPDAINRVVKNRLSGIQAEYEVQLKKDRRLGGGKVAVRFVISPNGDVSSAEVVEDTVGNAALSAGIVRRVRSWQFPSAGGESVVIYPFVFVATVR